MKKSINEIMEFFPFELLKNCNSKTIKHEILTLIDREKFESIIKTGQIVHMTSEDKKSNLSFRVGNIVFSPEKYNQHGTYSLEFYIERIS